MNIILLEKVKNLGGLGDEVAVKPGYGRNYLIPNGKAVMATESNRAVFEARRAELEQSERKALDEAKLRQQALEGVTLQVAAKAGDEGKLFGSVGPADVVDAMKAMDITVQKSEVRMHGGPIRTTGAYEVEISLHPEVSANVTLSVVAES